VDPTTSPHSINSSSIVAAATPDGDLELDFGSMKIGTGRYFRWGAEDES
jgi:hypothetical protein